MNKNYLFLCLCLVLFLPTSTVANPWTPLDTGLLQARTSLWITPDVFRLYTLNLEEISATLNKKSRTSDHNLLQLPSPQGLMIAFEFMETDLMAPQLAAAYPHIKTFQGWAVNDRTIRLRFDLTTAGFHAQILDPAGAWYIDPYSKGQAYASYLKQDYHPAGKRLQCLPPKQHDDYIKQRAANPDFLLRTYRLAVATSGEYTQYHGGTVEDGLSAIITTINRVSGIYESELAIRFELVAGNHKIIFTDPDTDGINNSGAYNAINQSQTIIDREIGDANYDIGHLFSTGTGGLAELACVCVSGKKAWGTTGDPNPKGDPFDVDYVCHEIGHQFGAEHTFNGCSGGNRISASAYEPGSGSTIMAYAGICGSDDLQPHTDPLFHSNSIEAIRAFVGTSCARETIMDNTAPVAIAGSNYSIPVMTPFVLSGYSTDADNDKITYLWEEADLGPQADLTTPDDGQIPLFRVYTPVTSGERFFPRLITLAQGIYDPQEKLPQKGRIMKFRLVVRDHKGGLGFNNMQITVDEDSGPFLVTSFNDDYMIVENPLHLTWNIAGTYGTVDIFLSQDSGLSFDLQNPLVSATPNDGEYNLTLAQTFISHGRIMIKGHANIFFDINDTDFMINNEELPLVLMLLGILTDKKGPSNLLQKADTNQNGKLDLKDAIFLMEKAAGI